MAREPDPDFVERLLRRIEMACLVTAIALLLVAVASVRVNLTGRWITPAKPGAFGETGWRYRQIRLSSGIFTFDSSSRLGFQGDASGKPPFAVPTGWRFTPPDRMVFRLLPRVRLDGLFIWEIPIVTLAAPALTAAVGCHMVAAKRRRVRMTGRCRACGYDLRGSPDRCPECGMTPT